MGTTANAFQFDNQGNFSAKNPQTPPLLTIKPSALLFNQMNPGAIAIQSRGQSNRGLRVPQGEDLLLVGGNVTLDGGQVLAQGGRIELGGLAENGAVGLTSSRFQSILSVRSQGEGEAGNITVNTPRFTLLDRGVVAAESNTADGGNINLTLSDFLLLRRNSAISATAGAEQGAGNGGNITINAPFIVAVPAENSDTTANAFTGNGGNIQITASGIFGTQLRDELTPESDITASSEFGIAGVVEINTPDVDPSQGLANLPAELVDISGLIASGCRAGGRQGQS